MGDGTLGDGLKKDSKTASLIKNDPTHQLVREFLKKMVVFSVREGPPSTSWASVDPGSLFSTFGVFESPPVKPAYLKSHKKGVL